MLFSPRSITRKTGIVKKSENPLDVYITVSDLHAPLSLGKLGEYENLSVLVFFYFCYLLHSLRDDNSEFPVMNNSLASL
jgi:hypothetical protein